ncbi:sigma-54-dependent Fis family transcriptional regulator [Brevibacillus choshinensis]|uniref:Sigma-54-dependent Fis family transcriptional regulator n=1 Tax=Brevibacillus choshinensis TaxID=54911 RepID=A0ABX7FNY6_BRECH|nr:sigma-54-dependent Fis family transcriptional regulator [Brevibacillus choshinensis]QRG67545.1 sigma-54-dependent Fis family transcriptional regulator [Brevibacillus choshinensis]
MSTIVQQSWKRCQESNLIATQKANDQIISTSRIKEIIQENHPLIRESLPLFNKLSPFLLSTEHIALLSDRNGNIIHTVGDPVFADHAQKVQLQIGANWQESNKGTNAIGTALISQQPIQIHGEQHYFRENQFLTCSSAPIFSPAGELLGVIDISTRKEYTHPFALTIVCMIAEALQNRFLFADAERVMAVSGTYSGKRSQQWLPLVGLDRDERIVGLNRSAKQLLGADVLGKELDPQHEGHARTLKDDRRKMWPSAPLRARAQTPPVPLKPFPRLAGSCPLFLQAKILAQKAAQVDFPVMILGESGTGKELFAQMIHQTGPRAQEPFVAVNCSSISENLIESELFGYEGGSFTGAHREGRIGKFEAARKGTIFLDEIGDMSLRAQAALLRVLQEKVVTPVGSNQSRPVHARVVAATHRNLPDEIKAGRFRADLYYRLKGVLVELPPLRKRSDILELAENQIKQIAPERSISLTREAKAMLTSYSWPGNVRELQGVLIQAAFLTDEDEIDCEHIQLENLEEGPASSEIGMMSLRETECQAIKKALNASGGNVTQAAKLLQIGRNTLYRKMADYRILPQVNQEEL